MKDGEESIKTNVPSATSRSHGNKPLKELHVDFSDVFPSASVFESTSICTVA